MKEIPLTKGFVALVDDEDYELLSQVPWCWCNGYAVTNARTKIFREMFGHLGITTTQIKMHRLILQAAPDVEVDHEHGLTLDNRRSELRLISNLGNHQNATSRIGRSIYKGVSWSGVCSAWVGAIMAQRKKHHLGYFSDEVTAALAYDRAAHAKHGEFARFNFPGNLQYLQPSVFVAAPRAVSGYWDVTKGGNRFYSRVTAGGKSTSLGGFETAYDAAIYRDYYIEKNNLTSRMNFS